MKKLLLLLTCAASLTFAQTSYVMNFNGSSAYDNLGNSVGSGFRTVECWFKPAINYNSSGSTAGGTLVVRDDATQTHEFTLFLCGSDWPSNTWGQLTFAVRYNGTLHAIYSNSNTWTAGTWYHVAGVLDPTSGMRMYVNGVLQTQTDAAATGASDVDNSHPTTIGYWPTATRYFNGEMDELRFWNRALSQSEIQIKMCQNLTPANETGLQGYYKFDEGSGTQVLDQTTNAYNGTVSGSTWVIGNACTTPSGNYAVNFNGSGAYDDLGTSVGSGLRTIECWFKPGITYDSNGSTAGGTLVVRDDATQTHEFALFIAGSDWPLANWGQIMFGVRHNGTNHFIYTNSNMWTAGTWYHIAGVIDPSLGLRMYINGVLQSQTDASGTTTTDLDNSNPTTVGYWPTATRYFNGEMDELRFWNRALSQSEIQTKMCQNLTPANETGLQGYYKFDEGSGTQVLDQTTNAYNGAVSGSTWVSDLYCNMGIKTFSTDLELAVYPNPAGTSFIIETSFTESATYRILNSMGQEVAGGKLSGDKHTVDATSLESGVYFLTVQQNNTKAVRKMIIAR